MKWEYFSKRRRISLKMFVDGAKSLEEAQAIFKKGGVDHPIDGSLELLFNNLSKPSPVAKKAVKNSVFKTARSIRKKSKAVNNAKRKSRKSPSD